MQSEAGATFLDVCASVEEDMEVETLNICVLHSRYFSDELDAQFL